MVAQQVAQTCHAAGRRWLPDHDQVEARVVELSEQVLGGPARRELEPQPRESDRPPAARRRAGPAASPTAGSRGSAMPIWEMVRNASSAHALERHRERERPWRTMRVRNSPASQLSETTSENARSVVLQQALRRPGCARPRRCRAGRRRRRPATTSASFHARLYASCRPVFMPCAPTGLWMCAASPSRKQRRSRNRSARR